jgi:hypothetical protein
MGYTFENVKEFLTSWGLHFDTPNGDSNDIPYPQVYERMREDAGDVGGVELQTFISSITDTTDSRTYLKPFSWDEIQKAWEALESPEMQKMLAHPIQFEYCECGCHCHSGVSKGIEYTIYNSLKKNKAFSLRRGHGILGTQLGPLRDTFQECVLAAQEDFDKIP